MMPKLHIKLLAFGLLAFLCAAGLASLGTWQLQRANAKQELLDGVDRAARAPVLPLTNLLASGGDLRFRAVSVRGEFLADQQILLDNQLREGQAGLRVYAALRLADGKALLVDRGWLARPDRGQSLPTVELPAGVVTLQGVLLDPPGAGLALGSAPAQSWPLLLTRIDLTDLQRRLALPLLDWVLEDQNTPRAMSIRAGMLPPERHRGYAVQWFGLSLTLLIIYGLLAWRAWRAARP